MSPLLTLIFSILAAVMLFLHGLAAFSEEMARLGGKQLRDALRRLTRTDWRGALVGAGVTAVVQSSSAVTSMAVGLSHNRTLTERGAFAVMIGANVGTTLTAWLVALNVTGLGRSSSPWAASGHSSDHVPGAPTARQRFISGSSSWPWT
ncbi:MAG: Na/Pi symporter [Candidatus Nitricoxidivorans perseverans]|uniref:Na/Pi symporter n=1 Tax=Candidatus Nitricoxidivorans perseverans TaxID=2975601 RepID=A0AA49IYP4_9PROT|nr:MAG: Na/Pi symporter [Candidatus Nitricoxidivorans perseverans]